MGTKFDIYVFIRLLTFTVILKVNGKKISILRDL